MKENERIKPLFPLLAVCTVLLFCACTPDVVRHNNAGNERFFESAYGEALKEYRQAQVDDPDRAEPYHNAANTHNRQGQLDATQAQSQQALKTADSNLAAQTWYNLGNAFFDAEAWPEAITAYQEALRIIPDDSDAKHNLELAQQKLEEQEQQQQDRKEEQDQEENNQQAQQPKGNDQSETDASTPAPESQSESSENQDPSTGGQEDQGMTPEQALQLLQAIVGGSETLQERLQEIYRIPAPPPEQDW